MVDRKDIGSWLQGPTSLDEDSTYVPGAGLGLPAQGPGSIARSGPRVVAIFIDWALCSLIAAAFLGYRWGQSGGSSFAPLAVFVVENIVLIGTLGSTFGHRLLGMHVVRVDGTPAGLVPATIRTLLLALVIPAAIWDKDSRGMHDRAAGTVLVRR